MRFTTTTASRPARRVQLAALVALSVVLAGSACSSDEGSTGSTGTTAPAGGDATFCEAFMTVQPGLFSQPADADAFDAALDALEANAPSEVADQASMLASSLHSTSSTDTTAADSPSTEELLASAAAVGASAAESCGDETLHVTAKDYEFVDMPTTLSAGEYGIVLANEGTEWHEMIVVRKNDGVTESAAELLALSDEDASQKVTAVAGTYVAPGATSGLVAELSAGNYLAMCFIPVGTTSIESESSGESHAKHGMVTEFTVS